MFWRNRPATRRLAQAWADLRVWPHHIREEGTYFSDQARPIKILLFILNRCQTESGNYI